MSSPNRNVPMLIQLEVSPFLSFGFLVFGLSWYLLFVLVVVGVVAVPRRGPWPERSPAEPEGRSV